MQPVRPALPEFDTMRRDSESSPLFRPFYFFPDPPGGFFYESSHQLHSVVDGLALRRDARTDAAFVGARFKILV